MTKLRKFTGIKPEAKAVCDRYNEDSFGQDRRPAENYFG